MTQAPENRTLNDKFMLRLPDGMRDRIKAAAETNNRSMNAEIVATLEEKYPAPITLRVNQLVDWADNMVRLADAYEAASSIEERVQVVERMVKIRNLIVHGKADLATDD